LKVRSQRFSIQHMCYSQALGENLDFSTEHTMTVIERFLKACSDGVSKRLLKYVLNVECKIDYTDQL
jgi:hypothetical protein